jgi:hypothetical protein
VPKRSLPRRSVAQLALDPELGAASFSSAREAEVVLGRDVRRCWLTARLCDFYNQTRCTQPAGSQQRASPPRAEHDAPIVDLQRRAYARPGPRAPRRRSSSLLLSPRSKRVRPALGTTALVLVPAWAAPSQRRRLGRADSQRAAIASPRLQQPRRPRGRDRPVIDRLCARHNRRRRQTTGTSPGARFPTGRRLACEFMWSGSDRREV